MTRDELLQYRLNHYKNHRNSVGEKIVRAVLRVTATMDAVRTANQVLERMHLLDVVIDESEIAGNAETILRAEIMAILAQGAYLPRITKQAITDRIVARMVPTRDNVTGTTAQRTAGPSMPRHEDLDRKIQREVEKLNRGERSVR